MLRRAGYEVIYPENIHDQCCGMPFNSKEMFDQAEQTLEVLNEASQQGEIPIYCDTSPCIMCLKKYLSDQNSPLKLFEPVEFIHSFILDKLTLKKQ